MMRIPTNRPPTHPGEILREEFLIPMTITQQELAKQLKMPYQRINEIVNEKRGISESTALRLSKFFGTSVEFWLNLQIACNLYDAQKKESEILESIDTFSEPKTLVAC
ncbi:HigA family addiction module antitoxin [Gloeocapsopsis dulcis]|uniref:Addiction module antidote protein, HigA family n=1 Tax=Gloeocapsopsis dulcis AAB1 = 1H9 TaxID=1433147 RepID=A0A6N8FZX6_9CHRO|nr:HigA family addiction module antitoxin [Gloeocapsopsis dulcis]MUL38688.1 addiction module antidote protein, HigA family [Gloeocapsopsis dulcis AAB1 = 1H9]WNN92015.1 HigA family addiction module antitoxin [Gloeocapsopsis dulcis]